MVDCIEENYEYYLPQSIMSELNTSFEVKKLMNDLTAKDLNLVLSNLKGHYASLISGKHSNCSVKRNILTD